MSHSEEVIVGRGSTKTLKQERGWCFSGIVRKLVRLERVNLGGSGRKGDKISGMG